MKKLSIRCDKPWNKLSEKDRDRVLYGTGDKKYRVTWQGKSGKGQLDIAWEGILPRLMRRFKNPHSERAKRYYGKSMGTARSSSARAMTTR